MKEDSKFAVTSCGAELQGVSDHVQARADSPDPPLRLDRPSRLNGMAAVLPVRVLAVSSET